MRNFVFILVCIAVAVQSQQLDAILADHSSLSEPHNRHVERVLNSEDGPFNIALSPVDCTVCKTVVSLLQDFIEKNTTETRIDEIAVEVCNKLQIDKVTPLVCHGIIREFGDEVIYIFTERFLDPKTVCTKLNLCKGSDKPNVVEEEYIPKQKATETREWKEMMEFTRNTIRKESKQPHRTTKSQTGTFIQISDLHFDARYKVGANAECERPLCCRESDNYPTNQTNFRAAGTWGDYNCDTPIRLLQHLWAEFDSLDPKPDFVIFTGDNTPHDVWAQTQNLQENRSVDLNAHIQASLPGWTFYPTLGNHESYPVDQFPNPPNNQWLYSALGQSWSPWLSADAITMFEYAGYYTTLITPGLRLISMNTQYCDCNNFWLLLDWQDPTGQLAWFNQTLIAAEQANEKVWIIGHIPFNSGGCLQGYQQQLWQIVDQHQKVISGMFFGHSHEDNFFVYKDYATNTNPIQMGFIAPSITPYTNRNNAFRVYEYDRTTFEVLNYHQHIMNLSLANEENIPTWYVEYDPKSTYELKSMAPEEWFNLATVKFRQNQTMIDSFQWYMSSSYGPFPSCDAACVNSTICDVTEATTNNQNACDHVGPGISLCTFMNYFCP